MANKYPHEFLQLHVFYERYINPFRSTYLCCLPCNILVDFFTEIINHGVPNMVHLYVLDSFYSQVSHSVLQFLYRQPRPFWQAGSGIVMESWTCYTEFGCPSGHSWMGLVLMEYIVRFYARWYPRVRKNIIWFYLLIVLFQCTVMLSRVILGMHTFN